MQYSLRTLFIVITILAVLCAVAVAPPHFIGAAVLGSGLLFAPPVLVTGAYYLRGNLRAFCIGGASMWVVLVPYLSLSMWNFPRHIFGASDEVVDIKITLAIVWVLISFSGLLGIGMRYLWRWFDGVQSSRQSSVTQEPLERRPPTDAL